MYHGFSKKLSYFNNGIEEENVRKFAEDIGFSRCHIVLPRQVHGSTVSYVGEENSLFSLECDALVTDRADVVLGIQVADCVPVFIYEENKKIIGLVHAGWRGSSLAITQKTIQYIITSMDADVKALKIVIGPSIGACCYEVGPDVAARFKDGCITKRNGKHFLDLKLNNAEQLQSCGIPEDNVFISDLCTFCQSDLFYSYRRGDRGKRMVALMGMHN